MSEIALVQVEARAAKENLQIIGYYAAAENYYDNSIDRVPAIKIAEKIVENNGSAVVVVVSFFYLKSQFNLINQTFSWTINQFAWI